MKKVTWFSTLMTLVIALLSACDSPQSKNAGPPELGLRMSSSLPLTPLQDTQVHQISYRVLKMLANDYINCSCKPAMPEMYFGSFIDREDINDQLSKSDVVGVYVHMCLTSDSKFYVALSGSSGIADSTLNSAENYPVGKGVFTFSAGNFDQFMDSTVFAIPTPETRSGTAIMTDRARFAETLTCDLNGDNEQDPLSTHPYGYMNEGEFLALMAQASGSQMAFLMGYDPTMFPTVMRIMTLSTSPAGTNQVKLVKMSPTNVSQYATFLDRMDP